jgi:hypothetical protein
MDKKVFVVLWEYRYTTEVYVCTSLNLAIRQAIFACITPWLCELDAKDALKIEKLIRQKKWENALDYWHDCQATIHNETITIVEEDVRTRLEAPYDEAEQSYCKPTRKKKQPPKQA